MTEEGSDERVVDERLRRDAAASAAAGAGEEPPSSKRRGRLLNAAKAYLHRRRQEVRVLEQIRTDRLIVLTATRLLLAAQKRWQRR
jgi:hypothetical protein